MSLRANCGNTRTSWDRRRSNSTAAKNRILFNRQRTSELTGRLKQLSVEIEQGAAQAAQVEARAVLHGESVMTIQGEVARVEVILANLAAATVEISGAHDSIVDRIAS